MMPRWKSSVSLLSRSRLLHRQPLRRPLRCHRRARRKPRRTPPRHESRWLLLIQRLRRHPPRARPTAFRRGVRHPCRHRSRSGPRRKRTLPSAPTAGLRPRPRSSRCPHPNPSRARVLRCGSRRFPNAHQLVQLAQLMIVALSLAFARQRRALMPASGSAKSFARKKTPEAKKPRRSVALKAASVLQNR